MPDVQEVFRMATQKVRPDPGAMERQSQTQRRRTTRQRAGGYAVLAILVIAAAVISVLALRPREQQPADQPEQPSAAELAAEPHFLDLDTGEARLLPENLEGGFSYVASPDGTMLAYSGSGTDGAIKVANIDGTDVRSLPPPPEGFEDIEPRWSPDGTKIVFQERADDGVAVGNIFVYDLPSGQKTQITDLELERSWHYDLWPSFSRHGDDEVIFHMPRSSDRNATYDVWSVPATGGEPRLVLEKAWYPMTNPSPGTDMFAVQFLLPTPDRAGRTIVTGHPCCPAKRQTLVEANESISWPTMSPDGSRIAYQDGGTIYVLEIYTKALSPVGSGETAEWLDNDTLIVAP